MWQKFKNLFHWINAYLASFFYGFSGRKIKVIGVTGTDGKTTTTHLIHWVLSQSGIKTSMISSVFANIAGEIYETGFHVTTPNPWLLQKLISQSVKAKCEYLVLEVTSHAIDQNRIIGINLLIAVVTNVSDEHLDYHKNYQDYLQTKRILVKNAKYAVLNRDDKSFNNLMSANKNLITYGLSENADINPKTFQFSTQLPGVYNIYNNLAAISVCKKLKIPNKKIYTAILNFKGVKGRYEKIDNKYGYNIIVDFAHTPNAFNQVLPIAKFETKGKLIHIFGCAGLRDKKKRYIMGKISVQYADVIVITEEDYRTEDVEKINQQIAEGCMAQGAKEISVEEYQPHHKYSYPIFFRINNRNNAIIFALKKIIGKNDTLILTGKAHETSICRGKIEYEWDEFLAVKKAMGEIG